MINSYDWDWLEHNGFNIRPSTNKNNVCFEVDIDTFDWIIKTLQEKEAENLIVLSNQAIKEAYINYKTILSLLCENPT